MRDRLRFLAFAAALASAGIASADTNESLDLTYHAPAACPDRAAFLAAVAARGGKLDTPHSHLEVAIRANGPGFAGALRVEDPSHPSAPREVAAASCAAVFDALSVVTAIALSPEQSARTEPSAAVTPPAAETTLASAPLPPPSATDTEATRRPRPSGDRFRTTGATTNAALETRAGTLRFVQSRNFTAYAGAAFGILPTPMPRFDLTMDAASFAQTPNGDQLRIGPVVRLQFAFFGPSTLHVAAARTQVFGLAAGLSVCLAPYFDTRGLTVLICPEFRGGAFHASTRERDMSEHAQNPVFLSVGIGGELRYNLGSIAHLSLSGGFDAMTHVSARLADGSDAFRSSLATGYALFGVGLHFD